MADPTDSLLIDIDQSENHKETKTLLLIDRSNLDLLLSEQLEFLNVILNDIIVVSTQQFHEISHRL